MKVFVANVRIDKHAYRPTDNDDNTTTKPRDCQTINMAACGSVYRNIRNHVTYQVRGGYRADCTLINVQLEDRSELREIPVYSCLELK